MSPDGYTVTVPGGWTVIPVTGDDISQLLALLGQTQPGVADLIRNYLDTSGARLSFLAVDERPGQSSSSGIPPNVNVLLQPTLGLPLDFVGGVVASVLGRIPGVVGPVTREKVSTRSGDAIRFTLQVQAAASTGQVNAALTQYLFVRGTQGYLVTFTTGSDTLARDTPLFQQIVDSITFP